MFKQHNSTRDGNIIKQLNIRNSFSEQQNRIFKYSLKITRKYFWTSKMLDKKRFFINKNHLEYLGPTIF